jgi:hypothetical protein
MNIPTNERETVFLFDSLSGRLGWVLLYSGAPFPDAIIGNGSGETLWAEFEYRARNFEKHGHDPCGCDLIVCWHNDWPGAPLPVWALDRVLFSWGKMVSDPYADGVQRSKLYKVYTIKLNEEKDAAFIDWLDAQENRTDAIRALIDRAMSTPGGETAAVDLGAIRAVVEAALDEKLTGLQVGSVSGEKPKENQTLASRLDSMEF